MVNHVHSPYSTSSTTNDNTISTLDISSITIDSNNNNNSNENKSRRRNTLKANLPAGITIIPPSPLNSISNRYTNYSVSPITPNQPIASSSSPSTSKFSPSAKKSLASPHQSSSHSAAYQGVSDRDYFSIPPSPSQQTPVAHQQSDYSSSSTTTTTTHLQNSPSRSSKTLRPNTIIRSQSHYISRNPHNIDKNGNIPSHIDTSIRPHPLKRLSIDDTSHYQDSYSIATGSDAQTPTQEYGSGPSHNGITRRRPSLSIPNNSNTYTSPRSRQSSSLRSPTSIPSSSSTLGWLTGNKLTLPPINSKYSKSDDEREDGQDEEEEQELKEQRILKKWDWRMSTNGIPKYGESSTSASGSSGSGSGLTVNTPFISMTPPPTNDIHFMPPPLTVNNGFNISPPRTTILPSQAPLASPSNLQPLPQDPFNILPLSLPSSPFVSPTPSRAPTPHQSPHPSLQDLASEYAASANIQTSSSGSGSSPRTSISTSSSRYGWGTGRSDSRSSEDDDLMPPLSPITTSSHRPGTGISLPRSGWWQRSLLSTRDNDIPVSPKITSSINSASRIIRFPISTVSANKFVPTGTRNWGWLFGMVQDKFGLSNDQSTSSPTTRKNDIGSSRKNSISAKTRNRERERLMSGHGRALSHSGLASRRKSTNQKVLGSKWLARVMVFVPTEPWSISLFLIFFAAFAVTLTFTIKHILNPDKEPLPWRQYCTSNYPTLYSLQDPTLPSPHINSNVNTNPSFPSSAHIESVPVNSFAPSSSKPLSLMPLTPQHPAWPYHPHDKPPFNPEMSTKDLDGSLNPVGVLIGVFTTDSGIERRHMIRQSYASHWRSRRDGTEGVRIRFVMGRPRKRFEKAVQLEMEAFNDILLLDMDENMNSGKTHAFFSWAAENATVPSWEYPQLSTESPESESIPINSSPIWKGERKPDYVVKADEDSFIMLGELEKRLRVSPRSKAFWGYLVKNTFMAGECYALSFDLVQYIHASPALRTLTRGKEDKLVAKWMNMHPEREQIVWVTERCWIYDHPKAGTVYSHGFLFPSTVAEVRQDNITGLSPSALALRGGAQSADSYSSVSKFGVAYKPISTDMTVSQQVEALIEGSKLSLLRETSDNNQPSSLSSEEDQQHQQIFSKQSTTSVEAIKQKINKAYNERLSRKEKFLNDEFESGGTVVVHYIKKNEWFIETMIALLGGKSNEDDQNVWHRGVGTGLGLLERRKGRIVHNNFISTKSEQGLLQQEQDGHTGQEGEGEGVKLRKGEGL
ncbi:uncharacterized protein L201_002174 [Kwoniella dendrophila CBS 6074]|uniref:Glycosyltransferase family 31 protein n=1 Tax=Kwoniella dendrophila CBS 6074 TaxID=1295534 RepID=A0AAX4JPF8_9TREE